MSYLDEEHIQKIFSAYQKFEAIEGFCEVVDKDTVLKDKVARLSVQFYVKSDKKLEEFSFRDAYNDWKTSLDA